MNNPPPIENSEEMSMENIEIKPGPISNWLTQQSLSNQPLARDHLGIEIIEVSTTSIISIAKALKSFGLDYLQCQGGYDEGPGKRLVSFYHLISISDLEKNVTPREVRLKIFFQRDGNITVPSLYTIFKGSDWQERETFDMYGINYSGHPHPKRLLMPEDWKGWPLRKDYVQPDFYEMQDAY